MKLNWNFLGEAKGSEQLQCVSPSMEGEWLLSGTAQCCFALKDFLSNIQGTCEEHRKVFCASFAANVLLGSSYQ